MTRQLHAAVPTSETPGCRLQRQNIQMRDLCQPIEFLRSTRVDEHRFLLSTCRFDETTGRFSPDAEFQDFSAPTIKRRGGGRLKDATVLAARSHAMLSPSEKPRPLIPNFQGPLTPFE
jgi:hypothetical protein